MTPAVLLDNFIIHLRLTAIGKRVKPCCACDAISCTVPRHRNHGLHVYFADAYGQLLSTIYEAAAEPGAWPAVLAGLAGLFRAPFADRFARTHDRSRFSGIVHGLDSADYQDQLLGAWSRRNVWTQRRPVKEAGEILTTREILPKEELLRSEMYVDYLRPRDLHEGMRLAIWSGEEGIEDISLLRPWSSGPYSTDERQVAARLMPHLRRAASLSRRLMRSDLASLADSMALERFSMAVLLLDGAGRIVHANPAAGRQLDTRDGLVPTAAGLVAAGAADTLLQKAIHLAAGLDREPRSATIRVPRPSGRAALVLHTVPVVSNWSWIAHERPRVLVSITDPTLEPGRRRRWYQHSFALTTAEAMLAEALVGGESVADVARRTGRSVNTVRTHLARLMAKTNTSRQVELVRLLLSYPGADISVQENRR